ncbi:uncharacterized protein LOC122037556 isoform X2 [Zingiber officinale]|uniref:Uncharacterized protein n=1 Tax=Zingiber officinale TaxID=94328 RepID=A0A8J5BT25_ZINOF|nr:uncharacterized protein LOC122037556 isoform X2 [Zingiber officinale]KAG6466235.1 hypothetical protein ZIOFF_075953 [Zingiber officinale]
MIAAGVIDILLRPRFVPCRRTPRKKAYCVNTADVLAGIARTCFGVGWDIRPITQDSNEGVQCLSYCSEDGNNQYGQLSKYIINAKKESLFPNYDLRYG